MPLPTPGQIATTAKLAAELLEEVGSSTAAAGASHLNLLAIVGEEPLAEKVVQAVVADAKQLVSASAELTLPIDGQPAEKAILAGQLPGRLLSDKVETALPPVPEGFGRVYRGVGAPTKPTSWPQWGRWFTQDLQGADEYRLIHAKVGESSSIFYQDVPHASLNATRDMLMPHWHLLSKEQAFSAKSLPAELFEEDGGAAWRALRERFAKRGG